MKGKTLILIAGLICLSGLSGFAQNQAKDSLAQIISNEKDDTVKVNASFKSSNTFATPRNWPTY